MIVLSWNCWELGNLHAGIVLSHLVRGKALDNLFLIKTKQTVEEMKNIQADLHYESMLAVPCVRGAGGLAMMWKTGVDLNVQTFSLNHIDARIMNNSPTPWRITGFYGRPVAHRKNESWELLRHLSSRDFMSWLCVGDYNKILSSDEKQGCLPRPPKPMEEFRQALLHCGLSDLDFIGNIFAWRNGRPGRAFVQERLDQACANTKGREIYPFARVHHLHAAYFDHKPILITIEEVTQFIRWRRKPKRFEERWASDPACKGVIREAWESVNLSPMYQLFEKIKACCMALVRWSRTFGNSKEQIELKYAEYEALTSMNLAESQD